jgi:hypothetical protein
MATGEIATRRVFRGPDYGVLSNSVSLSHRHPLDSVFLSALVDLTTRARYASQVVMPASILRTESFMFTANPLLSACFKPHPKCLTPPCQLFRNRRPLVPAVNPIAADRRAKEEKPYCTCVQSSFIILGTASPRFGHRNRRIIIIIGMNDGRLPFPFVVHSPSSHPGLVFSAPFCAPLLVPCVDEVRIRCLGLGLILPMYASNFIRP